MVCLQGMWTPQHHACVSSLSTPFHSHPWLFCIPEVISGVEVRALCYSNPANLCPHSHEHCHSVHEFQRRESVMLHLMETLYWLFRSSLEKNHILMWLSGVHIPFAKSDGPCLLHSKLIASFSYWWYISICMFACSPCVYLGFLWVPHFLPTAQTHVDYVRWLL